MGIIIKNEGEKDYRIVEELTREAFWNLYVPGCTEHFILHNLRNSVDFIPELDFIAEKEGQIVGHIVYSRGKIQDKKGVEKEVISFGPVSVLPRFQKQVSTEIRDIIAVLALDVVKNMTLKPLTTNLLLPYW